MKSTPEIFEEALRELIARHCADTIPASWIHCAMRPADLYNDDGRRVYPQLYVKASGKKLDDNGAAWVTSLSVSVVTDAAEDRDGSKRSMVYCELERLFEHLLDTREAADAVAGDFSSIVAEDLPEFCLGGFVPEAGDPSEVGEDTLIGTITGALHYEY